MNNIDFEEAYQLLKEQVKKDNHILGCDCSKKDKEIERLSKEVDMWNRKYNEQINIMNELEKELEQEIAIVGANRTVDNNNPEWWYKLNCYGNILNKLKELKEGKE